MMQRLDDPLAMQCYHNRFHGNGKALLILGGSSGKDWQKLRDEIQPDVILGANGTCFEIQDLDYHLVVENLHLAASRAAEGDARYRRIMEIVSPCNTAKVKLISYLNWKGTPIIDSRVQAIRIKRIGELGDDYVRQLQVLSLRNYGEGFLAGPVFHYTGALTNSKIKFRVGTVAAQLLHLAGILGVREVHSIGMDFCEYGHWYDYPTYQPDRFRSSQMFTEYRGLKTQWDWVQGAQWLKSLEWIFVRDGLEWHDHSHGLLEAEGLWCAV